MIGSSNTSPVLVISVPFPNAEYVLLSTPASHHVCILTIASAVSGIPLPHACYLDLKHPILSAVVNTISTVDHQRGDKMSTIEISCYQHINAGDYAVQQYQIHHDSVVSAPVLAPPPVPALIPVVAPTPVLAQVSSPAPEQPKAATVMSILSNSAVKTSVLSALFPAKESPPVILQAVDTKPETPFLKPSAEVRVEPKVTPIPAAQPANTSTSKLLSLIKPANTPAETTPIPSPVEEPLLPPPALATFTPSAATDNARLDAIERSLAELTAAMNSNNKDIGNRLPH